jgi:hypothetical protein
MSPKLIHSLSGDEIRKECIKLGLSGRFTMKEALVKVSTALVRSGKDPRTSHFDVSLFVTWNLCDDLPCVSNYDCKSYLKCFTGFGKEIQAQDMFLSFGGKICVRYS